MRSNWNNEGKRYHEMRGDKYRRAARCTSHETRVYAVLR